MKPKKLWILFALGCLVFLATIFFLKRERSAERFSGPPVLDSKAENLRASFVTAHLDVPIQGRTNLLWCGTFQLAWNEATNFFGEPLSFAEDVPLAIALNRGSFTRDNLDEASYVTAAGVLSESLVNRIQKEIKHKFGGEFSPELIPPSNTNSNEQFLFYACLFKALAFEKEFQRIDHPLIFGTNEVAAFGLEKYAPGNIYLREQIRILDYNNTNDFVIELKTKSKMDTLILAKVPPKETFAAIVANVRARTRKESRDEVYFDKLIVPKIDFKLLRAYTELEGKHFALKKSAQWNDLKIASAKQMIRFRLDERGALLKSEAEVAPASSAISEPVSLIFDQPFLVLLQRANTGAPYFALWIDNAELLVPWKAE